MSSLGRRPSTSLSSPGMALTLRPLKADERHLQNVTVSLNLKSTNNDEKRKHQQFS
jgi:hypothetical protein